jgi:hypothetical protein
MRKLVSSYSFNKNTKQIISSEFAGIPLESILLILDVTNNTIIYQPNDATAGGSLNTTTLTLIKDTTGSEFSNSDNLQIFIEAVSESVTVANFPATQNVALTSSIEVEVKNDAGNPLPVSAASLPLPAGASTSANQVTANSSLATIATNIPVQGQALASASMPVVLPATQIAALTPPTSISISNFPATQNVAVISSVEVEVKNGVGNPIPVNASSLPLPTGASTEATLGALNSKVITTANGIKTDGSATTQPISAVSLPLPTGAATAALQTAGNASLASVDSKLASKTLGTQVTTSDLALITNSVIHGLSSGGGGGYVDVKVNPSGSLTVDASGSSVSVSNFPATQPVSAASLPLPAGAATETTLAAISSKTPALGQALSSASSPVVIASDQGPIPVTTSSGITIQTPTSNALSVLNATVQYQLETGGLYYLTITNAPASTTAFNGTITFQSSANGSSWSPLTVMPVAAPSVSAATSTTSSAGLYLLTAPPSVGSETIFIRAQMTSYTSGTAYFFASPAQANSRILIPWTPTVTSGQTVVPVIDVSNLSEVDIQLTAMTTTVYTAQATNDPTLTNWTSLPVQDAGQNISAGTLTIFASGSFRVQVAGFKWMRIQCTTTGTVATIQGVSANVGGPQNFTSYGGSTYISSIGSGTITTVGTVNTVAAVTASNTAIPGTSADVASSALTTTTTSATLTPTFGCSYSVNIPVTAVSGTSPTLDIQVQESADSGTNWYPVYDFPRITTTGSYNSPQLTLTGNRVRYVQTVTGTTPSFTRAINRLQASTVPQALYRQLIDRTVSLTTLSSTTPSLTTQGAKNACQLVINIGAATTPPSLQLQGSDDNGATFYSIGTPLAAVASSTVQLTVAGVVPQTLRAIVTSAGTGVTAGYVLIRSY